MRQLRTAGQRDSRIPQGDDEPELIDRDCACVEVGHGVDSWKLHECVAIKACPFCGGKVEVERIPAHSHGVAAFMGDASDTFTVECLDCASGFCGNDLMEVVAKWNRRECDADFGEFAIAVAKGLLDIRDNATPSRIDDLAGKLMKILKGG